MGIAAYNRGTAVLSREIDKLNDEWGNHNREVINNLNAIQKNDGAGTPYGPVLIEMPTAKTGTNSYWWLMRDSEDRHSRYAFCYKSIRDLMREWNIAIVGVSKDKHGLYYSCVILEKT